MDRTDWLIWLDILEESGQDTQGLRLVVESFLSSHPLATSDPRNDFGNGRGFTDTGRADESDAGGLAAIDYDRIRGLDAASEFAVHGVEPLGAPWGVGGQVDPTELFGKCTINIHGDASSNAFGHQESYTSNRIFVVVVHRTDRSATLSPVHLLTDNLA